MKAYFRTFFTFNIIVAIIGQDLDNDLPNITLLSNKINETFYNMSCVISGSKMQSAITWMTPTLSDQTSNFGATVSKFVPNLISDFGCNFDYDCNNFWPVGWTIIQSFEKYLGAVTDYRWEHFPTINTEDSSEHNLINFKNVARILNSQEFYIPISLRAKYEAHIFLCDGPYPPDSNCYWIILSAWKGAKSVIRKCRSKFIPNQRNKYAAGACAIIRTETNHTNPLNETQWTQFVIKKNNETIAVENFSRRETFLNYNDDLKELINVQYLSIYSLYTQAQWKIHDYKFIWTNVSNTVLLGPAIKLKQEEKSLCIAMFVTMCLHCYLQLNLADTNSIAINSTTIKFESTNWREIKFVTSFNGSFFRQVKLFAYTYSNGSKDGNFWAIDDVRKCSEQEFRVLQIDVPNKTEVSCKTLDSSLALMATDTIDDQHSNQCDPDTFGKNCIPCNLLYGSEYCLKTLICYWNANKDSVCSCSSGYRNSDCSQFCIDGHHGFNCTKKCGNCLFDVPCDPITGNCFRNVCEDSFLEPFCNDLISPILEKAPAIIKRTPSSVTLMLDDISYHPRDQIVTTYKIQYKKTFDNQWNYFRDEFSLNQIEPIEITNLSPSTSYEFRAILFTSDKIYEGIKIPTTIIRTNCTMVTAGDVQIETTNISARLTFKDIVDRCNIDDYEVGLAGRKVRLNSSNFQLSYLHPFTNYTVDITCLSCQRSFQITFATKEGESMSVRNLISGQKTLNTIRVSWDRPAISNGIIKYYKVVYQHSHYLGCVEREKNNQSRGRFKTQATNFTIPGLISHSEYLIEVSAFTVMDGKALKLLEYTSSAKIPENDIVPNKIVLNLNKSAVKLTILGAPCTNIKGNLFHNLVLECLSEWCVTKPIRGNITHYTEVIDKLLPYTNYSITIRAGYLTGGINNQKSLTRIFRTEPSEAGKVKNLRVYSKNATSISLRFQPPYPPTGELEEYNISYSYYYLFNNHYREIAFEPKSCKIWTSYHCIDLTNLVPSFTYEIKLHAKNFNTSYGPEEIIEEKTQVVVSRPPENLKGQWDDYHNYTLSWNHPNFTNGAITKFVIEIAINGSKQKRIREAYNLKEADYSLQYKYKIKNALKTSAKFSVAVSAHNNFSGDSAVLTNQVSPPKHPILLRNFSVINTTNATITLRIPAAVDVEGDASFLYIIVTDLTKPLLENNVLNLSDRAKIPSNYHSWIAGEIRLEPHNNSETIFTIGAELSSNTLYTISVLLENTFYNFRRYSVYKVDAKTEEIGHNSNNSLYFLLLLLVVPVLLFLILRGIKTGLFAWCGKAFWQDSTSSDLISLTTAKPEALNAEQEENFDKKYSKSIATTDFEYYVKILIDNIELERQFQLLSMEAPPSSVYGTLPQNHSKNSYNNAAAYDLTRVVLEKIDDDPYSDYINANYINSYKIPKAYIATQAPSSTTIVDFWRMIWQENVQYIVILADVDGNKIRTEKYWPDLNKQEKYRNVRVQCTLSQEFTSYEIRTLLVICNRETRRVQQLHFKAWSNVQSYPHTLVPFARKLLMIPLGKSPIVVHGSFDSGYVGILILCDICLRMAEKEKAVNVLHHLHKIRDQRPNLVTAIDQYKLAHLIILECLISPQTAIPSDKSLQTEVAKLLRQREFEHQLEYLNNSTWRDEAMRTERNLEESLYANTDRSVHHLAVPVDGLQKSGKFIVTPQPTSAAIADFWGMVCEKEVGLIVSLNEIKSGCQFWPNGGLIQMNPAPLISLHYIKVTRNEIYSVFNIDMTVDGGDYFNVKPIKIIEMNNWKPQELIPKSHRDILQLLGETMRSLNEDGPIVVTCQNGVTASGLFVSLSFVIEKIKLEQMCDVCLAVRTVGHNRKQFVNNKDQLIFLYQAALKYLSEFQAKK